jgi:hypothetical protein
MSEIKYFYDLENAVVNWTKTINRFHNEKIFKWDDIDIVYLDALEKIDFDKRYSVEALAWCEIKNKIEECIYLSKECPELQKRLNELTREDFDIFD